jgi:hypothetical protein
MLKLSNDAVHSGHRQVTSLRDLRDGQRSVARDNGGNHCESAIQWLVRCFHCALPLKPLQKLLDAE